MTTPEDADHPTSGARLAEELRLLLDALAERAQPLLNRLAAGDAGEHTPATCGWCPVCAGIAVVRGERPELAVKAAEHASGLLAVLRAALTPEPAPSSASSSSASEERVQHITLRRREC